LHQNASNSININCAARKTRVRLRTRHTCLHTRRFGTENSKVAISTGTNPKRGFSLSGFLAAAGITAAIPLLALDWAHRNPDKVTESGLPSTICDILLSEPATSRLAQIRSMLGLNPNVYNNQSKIPRNEIRWNGDLNDAENHLLAQKAVVSDVLENAYFVTLSLSATAKYAVCASRAAKALLDAEKENLFECEAAIGFSQHLWSTFQSQIPGGASTHDFEYEERQGDHGFMPATGGDIFLHIKGGKVSDCFELGKLIVDALPEGSIEECDCVHGFQYQNKQKRKNSEKESESDTYDISGSKINVANPKERARTALIPTTGGSYVLAQKWRHDLNAFKCLNKHERESVFGKTEDGLSYLGEVDIDNNPEYIQKAIMSGLPKESHVARVIGMNPDCTKIEIVRQSLPYGNIETVITPEAGSVWKKMFYGQVTRNHVSAAGHGDLRVIRNIRMFEHTI